MRAVAGLHGPPYSSSAHDDINQLKPCDLCYRLPTPPPPSPLPCPFVPRILISYLHRFRTRPPTACSDVVRPSLRDVGRLTKDPRCLPRPRCLPTPLLQLLSLQSDAPQPCEPIEQTNTNAVCVTTFAFGDASHLCEPSRGNERERDLCESVRGSGSPPTSPIWCIAAPHSPSMLHVGDEMWGRGHGQSSSSALHWPPSHTTGMPSVDVVCTFRSLRRSYSPPLAFRVKPTKSRQCQLTTNTRCQHEHAVNTAPGVSSSDVECTLQTPRRSYSPASPPSPLASNQPNRATASSPRTPGASPYTPSMHHLLMCPVLLVATTSWPRHAQHDHPISAHQMRRVDRSLLGSR
ncbi:hypothetical protein GALMADRAFT_139500 [Galerina marginata CBS 339.88]|uniref:Uncharacterized protein n=1 Tax=Galerina marginata (strain CBS 339.88) TaxID=685588 RepID=A0A067TC65_GALM3|nr:hypothetical protein GALMADRAFT_139500 [Galerina marginata CBS 339.88]